MTSSALGELVGRAVHEMLSKRRNVVETTTNVRRLNLLLMVKFLPVARIVTVAEGEVWLILR